MLVIVDNVLAEADRVAEIRGHLLGRLDNFSLLYVTCEREDANTQPHHHHLRHL